MSNNTVVLSKENVQQAILAIRFALQEGKTPTFEWRGDDVKRIKDGQVCSIKAVDTAGDIFVCAGDWQGTLYTKNVLDGEVVLGISGGQMEEYAIAHIEKMKADMQAGLSVFNEKNTFRPGQFIQWKPGMKTSRVPEYGVPVIVVDVLAEPKQLPLDSCNNHSPDRMDLVIGMVVDGVFQHYYTDSRRFMPHE
jgi:hypothetical protein